MRYQSLSLPPLLRSDPEIAWNFWLMLQELSESLWDRHEHLFDQWARDEFGSGPDLAPQDGAAVLRDAGAGPPGPAVLSHPAAYGSWPLDLDPITDDDIPF